MKNTIILISLLSVAIVAAVIILSMANESQNHSYSDTSDYYTPSDNFDIELSIVTSEVNFWDRVAALKATEAPETVIVTDESGNPVTDEEGNPFTETVIKTNGSDSDASESDSAAVTEVPEKSDELSADTTK